MEATTEKTPGQRAYEAYIAAHPYGDGYVPYDEFADEHRAAWEAAWEAMATDERQRIAGILAEASAAFMCAGVDLVSGGNDADGLRKISMAATLDLAANLVRGKVPQPVHDQLPPSLRERAGIEVAR